MQNKERWPDVEFTIDAKGHITSSAADIPSETHAACARQSIVKAADALQAEMNARRVWLAKSEQVLAELGICEDDQEE